MELTIGQERSFLTTFKQWGVVTSLDEGVPLRRELYRLYLFKNFADAFQFMTVAVEQAIVPQDHHPRWQNSYNRVEVWLSTHSAGDVITRQDCRLAESLESIWQSMLVGDR